VTTYKIKLERNFMPTIATVLEYLKSHQQEQVFAHATLGKEVYHTINNEIVRPDKNGEFTPPLTELEIFKKMMANLKLSEDSEINQQSEQGKKTLLIQAVLQHENNLSIILLNHGADPTICDANDNNALMHSALSGHSRLLSEMSTLIQTEAPAKPETHKTKEEKFTAPAAETILSPKTETKLQAAPAQKAGKTVVMARVRLNPDVLKQKNKSGQTLLSIMRALQPKQRIEPKKELQAHRHIRTSKKVQPAHLKPHPQHEGHDDLSQFKTMLAEWSANEKVEEKTTNGIYTKNNAATAAPPPPPPSVFATDTSAQDKVSRALRTYNKFFNRRIERFQPIWQTVYFSNAQLVEQTRQREKVRTENFQTIKQQQDAGVNVADLPDSPAKKLSDLVMDERLKKFPPTQPDLPLYFEDRARIQAALAILKDYYAPQSAPLPHFLQCNGLRRLMTFHTGRRYCAEAEKLFMRLNTKPMQEVKDVMNIYKIVKEELDRIAQLQHHKTTKNDIFNSSYTRRLRCLLDQLAETKAYKAQDYNNDRVIYLNDLDTANIKRGILQRP
jgi:hypothetical protein